LLLPKKSYGSVTVFSAWPRDHVEQALRRAARGWMAQDRRVCAVGYFGSYATDRYAPGSDLDVIILVSEDPEPHSARSQRFCTEGIPVACDLFVYTAGEWASPPPELARWIEPLRGQVVWVARR